MNSNTISEEEHKEAYIDICDLSKRRKIRAWCGECFQTFENGPLSKQCLDHLNKKNCNLIECRKTLNNSNFKCVRRFKNINSENRHTYCIDMSEVNKWDKNIRIQHCIRNLPKEQLIQIPELSKNSQNKEAQNKVISRDLAHDSILATKTVLSNEDQKKFFSNIIKVDAQSRDVTKILNKPEFQDEIDSDKKSFLENFNENTKKNDKNQSLINSSIPNYIENYNLNNSNLKSLIDRCQGPIFTTKYAPQANFLQENKATINGHNNKINPNKWDDISIDNKNMLKFNNVDLNPNLEKNEIYSLNDDFFNNPNREELKKENIFSNKINSIENFFNNNNLNFKDEELSMKFFFKDENRLTEGNVNDIQKDKKNLLQDPLTINSNLDLQESFKYNNLDNINNNINMSKDKDKIITADNFFEKQMDEESLASQLDKMDFIENSNLKTIPGKRCENNQLPVFLQNPDSNSNLQGKPSNIEINYLNYNENKLNKNMIKNQNYNSENAIIKDLFSNENLIKNDSYSSISPKTIIDDYNEYIINNDTDLDLIFDMIYKSQKISLDVMYNLRNKLRIRGYNTVLSLRLKKDRDKSWRFLYEDYKDISPEIEALALLIEYYLEKKLIK